MNKKPKVPNNDPGLEFSELMQTVAASTQQLMTDFLANQPEALTRGFDQYRLDDDFFKRMSEVRLDPAKAIEANVNFWKDAFALWGRALNDELGVSGKEVVTPEKDDYRFRSNSWSENQIFDFIKQSYLLVARYIMTSVDSVEGLDEKKKTQTDFFIEQYVNAMAPTNFILTNPDVLRRTIESDGQNLLKGFQNILVDLERGGGQLKTRMVDADAFELGKNVAVTPGKIIYQNDLIQLIQYEPTTAKVNRTPLLIVPPWINKYYILDLQPKNSFIGWLVAQGHTVFVISWINPDSDFAEKGFDDYLLEGPLAALDAIETITGSSETNAIGYCLGGTLLSATLAYLSATEESERIASATFLATMIDFSNPGDLGVFIDHDQVTNLETKMDQDGYLDGSDMATTFNMLRANDLIWSFVVNSYLMGDNPPAFDLLYWNSDSTRMPAKMHSQYLRKMYLENSFKEPGGMTLAGIPLDVSSIKNPAFFSEPSMTTSHPGNRLLAEHPCLRGLQSSCCQGLVILREWLIPRRQTNMGIGVVVRGQKGTPITGIRKPL
ncbi:PHA/PHB synthase family protein [Arenicellales bacterium nBUS_48]